MFVFQILLGFGLGIISTKVPSLKTTAWLIAYYFGKEYGLISIWFTESLCQIVPQLIGGFDEYGQSIGELYLEKVNIGLIQKLIKAKIIHLFIGLLIGSIYSYFGFKGFGPTFTSLILALVIFCKYGHDFKVWLTLMLMAAGVYGFSLVGVANAPIVFISVFTANALDNKELIEETADPMPLLFEWIYDPYTIFAGAIGGVMPGLNSEALLKNAVGGWCASATAEGVSLSVLLLQRSTSKTTLTTYLSQLGELNISAIAAVVLLLVLAKLIYDIPAISMLTAEQYFPPFVISKCLSVLSTAYFLSIPDQPLLTLVISFSLHYGFDNLKSTIGIYPSGFSKTLASSPILFLG